MPDGGRFSGAGGTATETADLFYSGEGVDGAPVSMLSMSNQATCATLGPISSYIDPNPHIEFGSVSQLGLLPHIVICNGTNYDGSGSTGFRLYQLYTNATEISHTLLTDKDWVFAAWLVNLEPTGISTTTTLGNFQQVSAGYGGCQFKNNLPTFAFRAHSDIGTGVGADITNGITTNVTYWVQLCLNRTNQSVELAVWRYSDWSFRGYSSNGLRTNKIHTFNFPRVANSVLMDRFIDSDNAVLKWSGSIPNVTNLWP